MMNLCFECTISRPLCHQCCICLSPSELQSFLLKTLRQKHTLLTPQHTLSDFRLNLCKNCIFQNQNLRTLKPSSISMSSSSSTQGTSMQLITGDSLQIKERSMKLEEWQLTVVIPQFLTQVVTDTCRWTLHSYVI